ncbi:hypothetical protein J2X67_005344 [Variovorax sp. 3319]|nr:hypothetical protein [Variovorax sp. 3319]
MHISAFGQWPPFGLGKAIEGEMNAALILMRLLQAELPVRVVQPEEIRHVSALLATGLIVAEISGLEPTG